MTDIRVTQGAIEVLEEPVSPNVRITQGAIEVLEQPALPTLRVTQGAIEVLHSVALAPPTAAHRTQFNIYYT